VPFDGLLLFTLKDGYDFERPCIDVFIKRMHKHFDTKYSFENYRDVNVEHKIIELFSGMLGIHFDF
jgi:hypothetical protein